MSAIRELMRTGSIVTQTPAAGAPQLTTVLFADGDVVCTVAGEPSAALLTRHNAAVTRTVQGVFTRLRTLRGAIRHTWWSVGALSTLALADPASLQHQLTVAGVASAAGGGLQLLLTRFVRARMGRLF